jgi:tetratricopeptide (TPR) repeat protein/tRNA A-37 threonylcarbamoyl transferase component Bud32
MATTDRNLLFGVLAVQLGFVTRDQLIAATSRWVLDKDLPLGEVFIRQGMISRAESQIVDGVVQKQLERNGSDARQTLRTLEGLEDLRETLKRLGDSTVPETVEFETIGSVVEDPYTTVASTAQSVGESKNRYTVLRTHQRGGLGCVSIALDEELNREIALKEILPAHADHEENRTRFIREAEITGALEHPGIVPVYSLGQFADGRPYYAMRFIRGLNLQVAIEDFHKDKSHSAEKQLAFRQLLSRVVDVCQALEYAHSRGVIHRDIKPGNIMLGDYGETLLVDWGLAKTLKDGFQTDESTMPPVYTTERASSTHTQIGRVVGTPSFMSPEQAAGRLDSLSPTSDIYSVGATLYQILTGEPPFRGTEEEVLGNVQLGRFKQPREVNSKIPRPLEAICLKAMARMPHERYQSAREMADDLERYLGDEHVLAYREPLVAKAWRWTRHHRALVLSTAAALAVAVTALTIGVVLLSAANVRERTERERAEKNFSEATEQRKLAERNFALARSAVHDYFITVSEDTLLQQPGMQGLREDLLRQALVYYQTFLEERQDDPSLRQEVADAHFYAGTIVQTINSPSEALPHFEKSAELQKALLEKSSEDTAIKSDYGQSLNAIGGVYFRSGKIEEARDYFQQASQVREAVTKADPKDLEAARVFANSVMNIGSTFLARQEHEQAIPLLERAQMSRMAHVDELAKSDPKLQRDLGMGYYQLAIVRRELGDVAVAESNFLTAVEVFTRLLENQPNEMGHQRNLALSLRGVADLKASEGEPDEAIEYFRRAEEILEELRLRNPDVHNYAAELAGVRINLAVQHRKQGQVDEGLPAAGRAVELLRDLTQLAETVPAYRMDLGIALREQGQLLAASGDKPAAQQHLAESKRVLSQLMQENPASDRYATELGLTVDALAELEGESESDKESTPATENGPK